MLRRVRIVLLGAPGSGKGTQGPALARRLGVPYISSGDLLRARAAADPDLRRGLATVLDRGDLVEDHVVVTVVRDALTAAGADGGYVLDGFPRTVAQAQALDEFAPPVAAVYLDVPDTVARRRLARRRLAGRADDAVDTVDHRLRSFHREIGPLLDLYRRRGILLSVDADQPPDAVTAAIVDALAGAGRDP